MPDSDDSRVIKVIGGLDEVPAAEWNACAGDENPFVQHGFLSALEESGSASADTGWLPRHILIENADGTIEACAPLYLKSHSYGEYVFDWGWAEAYERAGGRYYPKLQCAVPFTPAPGPRLLVRNGQSAERTMELKRLLTSGMARVADQLKVSSVHITFCEEQEWVEARTEDYLPRLGQQFHWSNDGYASFDDFLDRLSSRKRKAIRKERRKVAETGLEISALRGDEIQERHWDAFYEFYLSTTDKKWGQSYLQRSFFSLLGERMGENVVLIMAHNGSEYVAGALNLVGADCLYGRNWGSLTSHKFLHFECCYYRAIDYAIQHGLARVEAGAQGPHKVQRGYLPAPTYSLHYLRDPGLRDAVEHFLQREQLGIEYEMSEIVKQHSPYKATS